MSSVRERGYSCDDGNSFELNGVAASVWRIFMGRVRFIWFLVSGCQLELCYNSRALETATISIDAKWFESLDIKHNSLYL